MTAATVLSTATRFLPDGRDHGRMLRVTWHPGQDQFVLSIWRENTCAATFQLVRSEVPALIASLAEGLASAPAPWSPPTTTASMNVGPRQWRQHLPRALRQRFTR